MGNANNFQELKQDTLPPTICHDYKCFQLSNYLCFMMKRTICVHHKSTRNDW